MIILYSGWLASFSVAYYARWNIPFLLPGKKLSGCESVVPVLYTLDIVTVLASFCIILKRNFLIVRTRFLLCSPVDTVTFLLLLCSLFFTIYLHISFPLHSQLKNSTSLIKNSDVLNTMLGLGVKHRIRNSFWLSRAGGDGYVNKQTNKQIPIMLEWNKRLV